MFKTIIIASLLSITAMAEEGQVLGCYSATNPQDITVTLLSEADGQPIKKETGNWAQIMMVSEGYNNEYQAEIPASVRILVKSQTLKTLSVASSFDKKDKTTYGIECDGGNVTVKSKGNGVVANSNYLASESTGGEGCNGPSTLKINNVEFKESVCVIEE